MTVSPPGLPPELLQQLEALPFDTDVEGPAREFATLLTGRRIKIADLFAIIIEAAVWLVSQWQGHPLAERQDRAKRWASAVMDQILAAVAEAVYSPPELPRIIAPNLTVPDVGDDLDAHAQEWAASLVRSSILVAELMPLLDVATEHLMLHWRREGQPLDAIERAARRWSHRVLGVVLQASMAVGPRQ